MEPKKYQDKVLKELEAFIEDLFSNITINEAWSQFFYDKVGDNEQIEAAPEYREIVSQVPDITLKVPTAGGKTVLAVWAIGLIFSKINRYGKPKFVLWLVPSDGILNQTLNNLKNPNHPYRKELDRMFGGRVNIVSRQQMLSGENFRAGLLEDSCTIAVMSFASLRINDESREARKAYKENGSLMELSGRYSDESNLEDVDGTALVNVIRQLNPLVIVDESHNATSQLSLEMLENVNPFFVLNLTATPRKGSNVLIEVDPSELKKEHMIKLPIVVYNRNTTEDVLRDAVNLRNLLEEKAKANKESTGDYIRPAVLLQAQPRKGEAAETFDVLRQKLIEMGIPGEQIAVKTAEIDELKGVDLSSEECQVRYVITVNALKEGWDWSFAYVLANVADKRSEIDVEQIIGRILRQPYCKDTDEILLSSSYVLTCSEDFSKTLEKIINSLNRSGVGSDMVAGFDISSEEPPELPKPPHLTPPSPQPDDGDSEERPENGGQKPPVPSSEGTEIADDTASSSEEDQTEKGEARQGGAGEGSEIITETDNPPVEEDEPAEPENLVDHVEDDVINAAEAETGGSGASPPSQTSIPKQSVPAAHIREEFEENLEALPKFVEIVSWLGEETTNQIGPATFSEGFKLSKIGLPSKYLPSKDKKNIGIVDVERKRGFFSQYKSPDEVGLIKQLFVSSPEKAEVNALLSRLHGELDKPFKMAASHEIESYFKRILEEYDKDEIHGLLKDIEGFSGHIKEFVMAELQDYRKRKFLEMFDKNQIKTEKQFKFPETMELNSRSPYPYEKSLYDFEAKPSNKIEEAFMDQVDQLDNVVWWHKLDQTRSLSKDFYINGFVNHHPDFILRTAKGNTVVVETKGADRNNRDTKNKNNLGHLWEERSGESYKYFLVFDKNRLDLPERSVTMDEIFERIRAL